MLIENIAYLCTFIITTGIAVIGVLTAYQLFQHHKNPEFQSLLYHQIFLFSFFIYGIWANIAIGELISELKIETQINHKLSFYIPLIGTPFLILSWFMLLRFSYQLNQKTMGKWISASYFLLGILGLSVLTYLYQIENISISGNPVFYITRILTATGLLIHLWAIIPFIKPSTLGNKVKKYLLFYFIGVGLYSAMAFFANAFGFISVCIFLILLFSVSSMLSIILKTTVKPLQKTEQKRHIKFEEFCRIYDISKRESEIILEICSGKSNKDIADTLFITLQTVKDHNYRIYSKTQVKSRVQLINLVMDKTGMNYKKINSL